MRFDISDLRLFIDTVDAGSITQGALRANLALASASERLRNMEQEAGVRLLERRPRGVTTTEAGEAVAHHARLMLHQRALLESELAEFASGSKGTIHLYANTAALTEFLPRTLAAWLASRPDIHVELKERTSVEIVRMIASGLADVGIVSDAVDAPGLALQPVATDHLVLIVPGAHPLARRKSVRFADILEEPFVGLSPGNALQEHIDDNARHAGRPLGFRIRMKTFDGLCEMVSQGVGIGIVPQSIATRSRRRHAFRSLALTDSWSQRRLCACFRNWDPLSGAAKSLLQHIGVPAPVATSTTRERRDNA